MAEELSKVYEPKTTENQANAIWLSDAYFHAEAGVSEEAERKAYTIVIPPPNVTAPLHLGHALNNTLQDILIRFRRMQKLQHALDAGDGSRGDCHSDCRRKTNFGRRRQAADRF
ncbi:MAG: class I tRNA ligase family protein [Planctomycetota bacterium]